MNYENVLALINAGFTVDEVRRMMSDPEPQEAPAEPEKEPVPEPDNPEPASEPAQDPVQLLQTIEALRQQIEDLRATFSAAAVRQDNFGREKDESVADVLTAIINPKTKKEVT